MKTLKFFLLAVIGSLSLGAAAQDYEVKGVVIDAKGNPVVGATVRTNKSKATAITRDGGVYTLTATPKDTELRLIINKYTVMEKELSAAIASHPIAFELDDSNDTAITGYLIGDTYYLGEADNDITKVFATRFANVKMNANGSIQIYGNKSAVSCYVVDGSVNLGTSGLPHIKSIYSITMLRDGSAYGYQGVSGAVVIVTKAYHEANKNNSKANISVGKDSIRGVVKDGWGRVVPDMKIKTPSGEIAVSDDSGRYAIRVTNKDKYLRCTMDYTEGTTVRISKANTSKPVNLIVMLRKNELRGYFSEDMSTYFLGESDEDWSTIIPLFPASNYMDGDVYFDRWRKISLTGGAGGGSPTLAKGCALIVIDGQSMEDATLESIEPHSVYCIQMMKENTIPLYGTAAQFGAVIITTKGQQKAAVAMTDFESVAARRRGDMKGFIAAQGKNLEYDDAGYILVNGKRCGLYIINDKEFTHMRGIEVGMIDDIIILNDDYTASYGPRAKNGVVLISASQKEKKVLDEEGNTVTEKEHKKSQKKK